MHHLLTAKAAATGTAIFMGGLGFENLLLNKTSRAYYFMRGSKPESSGENLMPVEHRHSHHSSRRHSSSDSHVEPGEKDASFDMYIYSMTYQPEFCRENSSNSFAGCKKPNEEWEGQLTIHGLWPEVILEQFVFQHFMTIDLILFLPFCNHRETMGRGLRPAPTSPSTPISFHQTPTSTQNSRKNGQT